MSGECEKMEIRKIKDELVHKLEDLGTFCYVEIEIYDEDFDIKILGIDVMTMTFLNRMIDLLKLYSYETDEFYYENGYGQFCFHCIEVD